MFHFPMHTTAPSRHVPPYTAELGSEDPFPWWSSLFPSLTGTWKSCSIRSAGLLIVTLVWPQLNRADAYGVMLLHEKWGHLSFWACLPSKEEILLCLALERPWLSYWLLSRLQSHGNRSDFCGFSQPWPLLSSASYPSCDPVLHLDMLHYSRGRLLGTCEGQSRVKAEDWGQQVKGEGLKESGK